MTKIVSMENKVSNEVFTVRSITRGGWLPKGHDGEVRYTGCVIGLQPARTKTGILITGLTKEDEVRLEAAMFMEAGSLNKYNNKFWSDYWVRIPKEGLKLDLSNPEDELKYLVLKAQHNVAMSNAEVADNMHASFVMTSVETESKVTYNEVKLKKEAYGKFKDMTLADQINFLKVYELGKNKVSNSATPDFIEGTVGTVVDEDPQGFLNTMKDPYFKTKVLIENCIALRAITRHGTKYYITGNIDPLGTTLLDTIETLNDPKNQDIVLSLKAKLEASKV